MTDRGITGGRTVRRAWAYHEEQQMISFVGRLPEQFGSSLSVYWLPMGATGEPVNVPYGAPSLVKAMERATQECGPFVSLDLLFDDGSFIRSSRIPGADEWQWAVQPVGYDADDPLDAPWPSGLFEERDLSQVPHRLIVAAQAVPREEVDRGTDNAG